MSWLALTLAAALACPLAPPAVAAPAKEKRMAQSFSVYRSTAGRFSCAIPADWRRSEEPGLDRREKVYGAFFVGPRSPDGVAARVSTDFYAPGNAAFPDAEQFLKAGREQFFKIDGEKIGPVEGLRVAGLQARRFTKSTMQFSRPEAMDSKESKITTEVVVVEGKAGFWVLSYSAAESQFKKHRPVFQRVLDSFRPAP